MFDKIKTGFSSILRKVKLKELSDKELDPIIAELEEVLIRNEVAVTTANELGKALKEELLNIEHQRFKNAKPMIQEAMTKAIERIFSVSINNAIDLEKEIQKTKDEKRPYIVLMLGINGTGKTTSIAKLTHLIKKMGFSVVLSASDTYRAGSIEQLKKHGKKLDVRVIAGEYEGDPAAVAIDTIDHAESKGVDVVIIDTAGRMQNNVNLVRELEKIVRMSEPDIKIFVGDSNAGNDVVRQAEEFGKDIGIDGIIMTKLDTGIKGGSVLSVAHITGKPILYIGDGQGYEHLRKFEPQLIVSEILP